MTSSSTTSFHLTTTTTKLLILLLLLFLLVGTVSARESKKKHDVDCNKINGQCGWTFQDAFCSHAKRPDQVREEQKKRTYKSRY